MKAECVQLDITSDRHNAYGLQFDDVYWDRYLNNLKPLGLAILLNTCNVATQEEFVHFSDHIACESSHNEVAVPVVNKRCLCQLARQIGFKKNAIKGYEYLYQVALFRHIKPEVIQKGKLAKSLNFPRLKMPFPNMTCAVIKDTFSNTSQLFSQGTGDLVLDACAEYWNGQNLVLLSEYERKKILEFYQRSSLTSYCCSFAYLPLVNENVMQSGSISKDAITDHYIELPPDSSHLFPSQRSLDASLRGLNVDHYYHNVSPNLDSKSETHEESMFSNSRIKLSSHHLSSDSLTKNVAFEQFENIEEDHAPAHDKNVRSRINNQEAHKMEQIMKKVVNEVFIGMATLQYQACNDFVRLIELMEAACIRFVHFSKENELRSRVFSEKMGLESGWNCHISLLNDDHVDEDAEVATKHVEAKHHNKLTRRNSFPSLGSRTSLNDHHDTDNEDSDDEILEITKKDNLYKVDGRRKHNSFSYSSERSSSVVSSTRRSQNFRGSSKLSNVMRNLSPSPSRNTTNSTNTLHSAPIAFDMSNRAKLPMGINNIRPHLENVDNVPLLVSLFTDCTPDATREMIKIMQEFEEVVCVIGSMANDSNIPIFLQADASISIDPIYPHACINEPIRPADTFTNQELPKNFTTPTDLANTLTSLPCSLSMPRQNAIIFYQLIMTSRDYMLKMRNIFQFFLSSCLSLSLAQMISSMLFLPPLLSPGIVLWLSFIVIPLLSVSLMGVQSDPNVMNVATGKKLHLNKEASSVICSTIF